MSKKEEILHKLSTEDRNYIKKKFKEREEFCIGQVESLTNLINVLIEENKELNDEKFDLEAKLAECEKGNDEWVKICDGKLETINRLIEEKHEFQQQLEDKEKHIIGQNALLNKSKENNNQLKQQLAEKEKENSVLKAVIDKNKTGQFGAVHICNAISEFYEPLVKDMIIAELEKVKEYIKEFVGINDVKFICTTTITDQIDQQIKSLKGDADV